MGELWRRLMVQALGGAALLTSCPALAASQGSLGPVSRGAITISVSIAAPARIAGLSDFELDAAGTADASAVARNLCFRGASRTYTVAASGSGPDGALSLSNGEESIAYRVEWLSRAGNDSVHALDGDTAVTVQAVADPSDCAHEQGQGQLRIAIDAVDAEKMQANAPYTGSLVLTLSPQ
jgi:hypothetical protein